MLSVITVIFVSGVAYFFISQWRSFKNFKSNLMEALILRGASYAQADELYTLHLDRCNSMFQQGKTTDEIAAYLEETAQNSHTKLKLEVAYSHCKQLAKLFKFQWAYMDIVEIDPALIKDFIEHMDSLVSHLKDDERITIEGDSRIARLLLANKNKDYDRQRSICIEIIKNFNAKQSDGAREEFIFHQFWPTLFKT